MENGGWRRLSVWQMASAKLRPALAAGCCTFIIISSDMYSTVSRPYIRSWKMLLYQKPGTNERQAANEVQRKSHHQRVVS